jgi:hypothetical protein
MHKCLNRAHRSCDKPLKAKVFFIVYPSHAVQLKFNNAQVLWIAKVSFSEIMCAELWTVSPLPPPHTTTGFGGGVWQRCQPALYKAGFQKTGLLKKIWPRKIAGLVTGLEWMGGCESVKKV